MCAGRSFRRRYSCRSSMATTWRLLAPTLRCACGKIFAGLKLGPIGVTMCIWRNIRRLDVPNRLPVRLFEG